MATPNGFPRHQFSSSSFTRSSKTVCSKYIYLPQIDEYVIVAATVEAINLKLGQIQRERWRWRGVSSSCLNPICRLEAKKPIFRASFGTAKYCHIWLRSTFLTRWPES
ncbi:hypothetical protein LXL04_005956 [Taraxacum kok-saghyz]